MNRRLFLHGIITSAAALSFGCSIKPLVSDKKKKVALIYATRYGATLDTAQWIAQGMEREVDLLNIETITFKDIINDYDHFIIGSGIWVDGVHREILTLLQQHHKEIQSKLLATFIVCGTTQKKESGRARIEQYFRRFHAALETEPPLHEQFGGRIVIEKLTQKDRKLLEHFYKKVLKKEFVSWDRREPKKAKLFGHTVLV